MKVLLAIFLSFISILWIVSPFIASWTTHKEMTIEYSDTYKIGNFDDFIREFNAYEEWVVLEHFPKSKFGKVGAYNKYEIHANIIKFNGVGMVLDFFSYRKVKKFIDNGYGESKFKGKW